MAYKNKADQASAARKHYEENRELVKQRAMAFKAIKRRELSEYVRKEKDKPCLDCNIKYPHYVMEYDHIGDDKISTVSNMVNSAVSLKKLQTEIAKCELVCSNCHRERTFSRLRKYDKV